MQTSYFDINAHQVVISKDTDGKCKFFNKINETLAELVGLKWEAI